MSNSEEAISYVINNEGGLVNNPHDPGGITKYGISLRFLKSISADRLRNYFIYSSEAEDIENLTIEQAKMIYKGEFWSHANFQDIIEQDCCNFIFDMAVNMGINPAIKCAQRACWSVFKKMGMVKDDGILGDHTIYNINKCGKSILPAMRSERAGYYRGISDNNKEFLNGWLHRSYNQ